MLQQKKQRREGKTKVRTRRGGGDLTIARLDSRQHRQESRSKRRVEVREMMEAEGDSDDIP
jgi:hypothetical protein